MPWRFSDAGRRSARLVSWVPASENLPQAASRAAKKIGHQGQTWSLDSIQPWEIADALAMGHARLKPLARGLTPQGHPGRSSVAIELTRKREWSAPSHFLFHLAFDNVMLLNVDALGECGVSTQSIFYL